MNLIFTLENKPGKKKYNCPSCGSIRTFTRYIYSNSGGYIDDEVGICDRINNCGYNFTPKQFFEKKPELRGKFASADHIKIIPEIVKIDFLDQYLLNLSMSKTHKSNLFQYLTKLFDYDFAMKLCEIYKIGSSNRWPGANVFWQVDIEQKIRSGKIGLCNINTGKRIQEPYPHIDWIHSVLIRKGIMKDFSLSQCFFGEHLLKHGIDMPVAIVEGERTAIECCAFKPNYLWLASGSANGLSIEKCKVLKGRKVVLFPDQGQFDSWNKKAKDIRQQLGINITVNSLIEDNMIQDKKGGDLVDYLIQRNPAGQAIDENGNLIKYNLPKFIHDTF